MKDDAGVTKTEDLNHPFFKSLNLSHMRNTVPPYVPDVKSDEDVSHFKIIDDVTTGPDITSLKGKKEFKNLPFVGFTYTAEKDSNQKLKKGESSLEAELKKKVSELELRNFQREQQVLNNTREWKNVAADEEKRSKVSLTHELN